MISSRSGLSIVAAMLIAGASNPIAAQATNVLVQPQSPQMAPARAELERRFRERTAQMVRRRLELNDNQMAKLLTSNRQFAQQRLALEAEDRQARRALRAELVAGTAANQQKVSDLLDQLLRLQRRRLDIVDNEQRELGKFLTPVQRAKFFGLQNEMRKRVQELTDRSPAAEGERPGMRRLRNPILRRKIR